MSMNDPTHWYNQHHWYWSVFVDEQAMRAYYQGLGYRNVRKISGVWCGVMDYFTTRSITVGLTPQSFERRYCFQDRAEADAVFAQYNDASAHPGGAWIKIKGSFRGAPIDAFNPNWPGLQKWDEVAPK